MSFRSRKFTYIYDTYSESLYEWLKTLPARYHMIAKNGNSLNGLIILKEATSESAIQRKWGNEDIYYTDDNPLEIREELMEKGTYWETGKIYNPKKKSNLLPINKSDEVSNHVMQQNELLLKKIMDDKDVLYEFTNELKQQNTMLLQQNAELQKGILQQSAIANTMTNTMSNSHNSTDNSKNKKITNVNVFLNTECKDAITLSDFISNLQIKDEDLMCMREHGYVESVSKLLNRALTEYDLYKRPIHCTDTKREVLHVKGQEGWKKETPAGESANIDKAFRHISHMHRKKMTNYYKDVEVNTKEFDEKASMMYKIASAGGTEEETFKKKIIKNIVEQVRL
jgi:hypothetical protein